MILAPGLDAVRAARADSGVSHMNLSRLGIKVREKRDAGSSYIYYFGFPVGAESGTLSESHGWLLPGVLYAAGAYPRATGRVLLCPSSMRG